MLRVVKTASREKWLSGKQAPDIHESRPRGGSCLQTISIKSSDTRNAFYYSPHLFYTPRCSARARVQQVRVTVRPAARTSR